VVASSRRWPATGPTLNVSIPFIAGQWSLLEPARAALRRPRMFQSPSLRGSGRFPPPHGGGRSKEKVSIPFIAGQWSLRMDDSDAGASAAEFQSPSLRGSGRFASPPRRKAGGQGGFNPLHCGAVVASRGGARSCGSGRSVSIPFIAGQWSLQTHAQGDFEPVRRVSIPFIAGQWSLRSAPRSSSQESTSFQSPSLRGSGRFGWTTLSL